MTARLLRGLAVPAALVVVLAGCGGGGSSSSQGYKQPPGPADSELTIDAGDFYFKPAAPTVSAGVVDLKLDSQGGTHTLVFAGSKVPSGFQLEVSSTGDTSSLRVDLKPGKYTFYCDIPGHRSQGMQGTLTVN